MRAHASLLALARAFALAIALAATLTACGKARVDPPPPDEDNQPPQPPRADLPAGALMSYWSANGLGGLTRITVFADGRVERPDHGRPAPGIHLPVARIEKLAADLAATGVFAQKNGAWAPSKPVPDGGGAGLVVRDKAGAVHAYSWSAGATAPDTVQRALQIGGAFASEVDRANPRPLCACDAGDPLCACL